MYICYITYIQYCDYDYTYSIITIIIEFNVITSTIMRCDDFGQFPNQVIVVWYTLIQIQSPDEKLVDNNHIT